MLSLILALAVSAGSFEYDAQGRRDPFVSQRPATQRDSLARDAKLTGVVRTPSGYVALMETTEGRTQFRRVGDRVQDATIVGIDAGGVRLRRDDRAEVRLELSR